jgi:hypothetical protein
MSEQTSRPPRDNIIRAVMPGVEFRAAEATARRPGRRCSATSPASTSGPRSTRMWEGRFMERFAPGAFKKTLREQGDRSGCCSSTATTRRSATSRSPRSGRPREDDEGAYYEAGLFDGLPPLMMDGLRAGQYGASFRFRVMREEIVDDPGASDDNPHGLPERTVKEAQVREFGPVTFPPTTARPPASGR